MREPVQFMDTFNNLTYSKDTARKNFIFWGRGGGNLEKYTPILEKSTF